MTSPRRGGSLRRRATTILRDPHVMLTIAVVLAAAVIELAAETDPRPVLLPAIALLAAQAGIALRRTWIRSRLVDTIRLLLALGTIWWMSLATGDAVSLPLVMLTVPIVVMAASRGARPALLLGAAAIGGSVALTAALLPPEGLTPGMMHRAVALIATMVLLSIGARRTIASLERAVAGARSAAERERRRLRQMAAVEAIGRLLAARGATPDTLHEVVDLLADKFGYHYVSVYTFDGELMRLGAQRGYADVIETFDGSAGVVGRVMRTRRPALVRDVLADPDYRAASPDVRSEVSVPLLAGDTLLGMLNVESGADDPVLDASDRDTMSVVADRIAASLALGSERAALLERAALFTRLATFAGAINASLDRPTAHATIADAVGTALESDVVTLFLRDPATGEDRIAGLRDGDERYLGARLMPGEGTAGRAMVQRRVVTAPVLRREDFPATMRGARTADAFVVAAMPLIHENVVIGAVSVGRTDLDRQYTPLELEAMPLIGSQVALALANVALHARVADAAIRDPLTGLWNRRHLEVSAARLFAARARLDPELLRPIAVILFDLDHFGQLNKRHGHLVGDAVLRSFGAILSGRLRSSDIVARFGGEEFVAILDGATAAEAQRVAEEIRLALEGSSIDGADRRRLRVTVSAGCASLGPAVTSLDELLSVADVALQMAKRAGRNQVVAA